MNAHSPSEPCLRVPRNTRQTPMMKMQMAVRVGDLCQYGRHHTSVSVSVSTTARDLTLRLCRWPMKAHGSGSILDTRWREVKQTFVVIPVCPGQHRNCKQMGVFDSLQ